MHNQKNFTHAKILKQISKNLIRIKNKQTTNQNGNPQLFENESQELWAAEKVALRKMYTVLDASVENMSNKK